MNQNARWNGEICKDGCICQFVHIFKVATVWTWGGVSDNSKKIVALATVVTVNNDNMVMVLGMLIMVVLVILIMNFLTFNL
jgi:predicted metal-dependent hydrolase